MNPSAIMRAPRRPAPSCDLYPPHAGEPLPEPQFADPLFKRWAGGNGPSRSGSLNLASPRDGAMHMGGHEEDGGPRPWVSPQAFAFDQWVYRDPQVCGPYGPACACCCRCCSPYLSAERLPPLSSCPRVSFRAPSPRRISWTGSHRASSPRWVPLAASVLVPLHLLFIYLIECGRVNEGFGNMLGGQGGGSRGLWPRWPMRVCCALLLTPLLSPHAGASDPVSHGA